MTIIVTPSGYTAYEDMVQPLRALVPGVIDFVAIDQLREACREFFRRSNTWFVRDTELFTTTSGGQAYTFSAMPSGAEICALMSAALVTDRRDRAVMWPGYAASMAGALASDDFQISASPPGGFLLSTPALTADVVVNGTVTFLPSISSSSVPTALFERWRDTILRGAASRLQMQPAGAWANPALAGVNAQAFEVGAMAAANLEGAVRAHPLRVRAI